MNVYKILSDDEDEIEEIEVETVTSKISKQPSVDNKEVSAPDLAVSMHNIFNTGGESNPRKFTDDEYSIIPSDASGKSKKRQEQFFV